MRFICFLLLLAFTAVIVIFGLQNSEEITIKFLDRGFTLTFALLVAAVYVLGMLSGWSVVGMLRYSVRRFTEDTGR